MAIEFNCPHCGVLYKLKDELAGKSGKCKNPKCLKPILIPFQSTVAGNGPAGVAPPLDAEALAAAAFNEEKPPPVAAAEVVAKKIAVSCQFCDHKFEADASMGGKNTPCPECGKIIRVPKPVENKPADWRTTASNKPSLAKSDEPIPTGAWEVQRKGVSGEALRKAGALEVEDEEEPRERRLRRIKQLCYGLALTGVVVLVVMTVLRSRREGKVERWMELAVKEMEDKNEGSKKPEFRAAIQRFSGEYHVRTAKNRDDLQVGLDAFNQSLSQLQNLPPSSPDRNAMLVELGVSRTICGGDSNELRDERRLPWEKVHQPIRQCFDKIEETELRNRAFRLVTRKLAEKDQGLLAAEIARNSSNPDADKLEANSRVGIELLLMGKKDLAEHVTTKAPPGAQPAQTALWLGLHPEATFPPKEVPHVAPPVKGPAAIPLDSLLAYGEGRALQGRLNEARDIAALAGNAIFKVEVLTRIAAVAQDTGKAEDAGKCLDDIAAIVKVEPKGSTMPPWLLARAAELAARAGKPEALEAILEAIKSDNIRSWAKLEVLRIKLAGQRKQKADESGAEAIPQAPDQTNLAQALGQAEIARHNAAAGESGYTRAVEAMPKGIIRPFGYAGTALGTLDRNGK